MVLHRLVPPTLVGIRWHEYSARALAPLGAAPLGDTHARGYEYRTLALAPHGAAPLGALTPVGMVGVRQTQVQRWRSTRAEVNEILQSDKTVFVYDSALAWSSSEPLR